MFDQKLIKHNYRFSIFFTQSLQCIDCLYKLQLQTKKDSTKIYFQDNNFKFQFCFLWFITKRVVWTYSTMKYFSFL